MPLIVVQQRPAETIVCHDALPVKVQAVGAEPEATAISHHASSSVPNTAPRRLRDG
jgi:hypothetical protein